MPLAPPLRSATGIIGQIWTHIHSLIWVKIEEGETGSGFGAPISVYISLPSPAQISNVSLSCASLICYP